MFVDDERRKECSDAVQRRVAARLGMRGGYGGRPTEKFPAGQFAVFFESTDRLRGSRRDALLSHGEVLAVTCRMDFDSRWLASTNQNRSRFWAAYAVAPNAGNKYSSFFRRNGREFVQSEYLELMRVSARNVGLAAARMELNHLVWFPYGMGAFLRGLGNLDLRFKEPQHMRALRREIAHLQLVTLLSTIPSNCVIHIAIRSGEGEAGENADAFVRAVYEIAARQGANLWDRVVLQESADVSEVCAGLATDAVSGLRVMMVVGSNSSRLGNRWEDLSKARIAIEENLHRRSTDLVTFAYAINYVKDRKFRIVDRPHSVSWHSSCVS
jgi:hypothetical protein